MPVTHQMQLHPAPFARMASGQKKNEIRLNDEKRRLLAVGDLIEFSNRGQQNEKLQVRVTKLEPFPGFAELYHAHQSEFPEWTLDSFVQSSLSEYYSPAQEKQWGALYIGIEKA